MGIRRLDQCAACRCSFRSRLRARAIGTAHEAADCPPNVQRGSAGGRSIGSGRRRRAPRGEEQVLRTLIAANPALRNLLAAQFVSEAGTWIAYVALTVAVYQRTGSAAWVSAVLLAGFLPSVVLAPLVGRAVDRLSAPDAARRVRSLLRDRLRRTALRAPAVAHGGPRRRVRGSVGRVPPRARLRAAEPRPRRGSRPRQRRAADDRARPASPPGPRSPGCSSPPRHRGRARAERRVLFRLRPADRPARRRPLPVRAHGRRDRRPPGRAGSGCSRRTARCGCCSPARCSPASRARP